MPRVIVSLDLETTGLDSRRDVILEVGAVKFKGDEVLETFSTFVDPERLIPPAITELTGIAQEHVRDAPRLIDVLPQLTGFVRNLPIVGHNIAFDLGFLNKHHILTHNESLDTFELASILVPHAGRYGLGALARELQIDLPATHRALDDAKVTHALYVKLFERARDIPIKTIEQLLNLSRAIEWSPRAFFDDALRDAARGSFSGGSIGAQMLAKQTQQTRRRKSTIGGVQVIAPSTTTRSRPLRPNPDLEPIDSDEIAATLEEGGAFEQAFDHFEHRSQQVQMLRAVCDAFNAREHVMVEAGTGTGKSIAYLLPAIHWAVQNGERVVISTNTINLQEQLASKDIPDLHKVLPIEFRSAVMKGRSHYLCPTRLQTMLRNGPLDASEMLVLAKVVLWLPTSVSGDGDELFLPTPQERGVWSRLSADNPTCTSEKCASYGSNGCYFHNARQEAEAAHVLIVNHALLLADVAAENRVLPDYRYLIIDEAHHLEAATTDQLSFSLNRYDLRRSFDELVSSQRTQGHGLLEDIVGRVRYACPENIAGRMQAVVEQTLEVIQETDFFSKEFFDQATEFIKRHTGSASDYVQRVRVTSALRAQPAWSNIEIAWDQLSAQLHDVVDKLNRVAGAFGELEDYDIPDHEDVLGRLLGVMRVLAQALEHTNAIVSEPSADGIYWAQLQTRDNSRNAPRILSLHSAPLHVGPLIEKHLFKTKNSVVLTSATLRIARSFNFVQERLNAQDVDTLAVGSPFDYKSSTLVFMVTDVPEPNMQGYQKAVDAGLIELCVAMGGRTLVLFTSYSQLRTSSRSLGPALIKHDIHVYEQSSGLSRRQLLEQFKNSERGVLLGTRSFWEGVDVPGEALSCLAIARLPFSVPTDPIFAARSETFEQAFMEYSVPDAVLRFRQGFGRLIRTKSDRGVVVLFDKRVVSKRYGRMFIESLPDCTVRQGNTHEIAQAVRAWMQRDS